MESQIISVYLDTNILVNYCSGQDEDIKIVKYLTEVRFAQNLYVSALSVAQTVSIIQSRKAKTKETKRLEIKRLQEVLKKITVVGLTDKEIINSFEMYNKLNSIDIEDTIHYFVAKKIKCDAIVTHNKSDFLAFVGNDIKIIEAFTPLIRRWVK